MHLNPEYLLTPNMLGQRNKAVKAQYGFLIKYLMY